MDQIKLLFYCFCAALGVASVWSFVTQNAAQKAAKALIRCGAKDEGTAKTVSALGFHGLAADIADHALRGGSRIGHAVCAVEISPEAAAGEDLLFRRRAVMAYYLPESALDKRLKRHIEEKTPLKTLIAVLLVLLAFAVGGTYVVRFLSNYASHVASSFGNDIYGAEKQAETLHEEQERLTAEEEERKREEEEAARKQVEEEAAKAADESSEEAADGTDEEASGETDG